MIQNFIDKIMGHKADPEKIHDDLVERFSIASLTLVEAYNGIIEITKVIRKIALENGLQTNTTETFNEDSLKESLKTFKLNVANVPQEVMDKLEELSKIKNAYAVFLISVFEIMDTDEDFMSMRSLVKTLRESHDIKVKILKEIES